MTARLTLLALTLTIFILTFSPSLSLTPFLAIPPPSRSFSFLLSLTVALLLCALGGRRVAILALGLFCQTDYGTSAVSLAPLHPIMRPASSLLPSFSLCLLVSVLIRHFAEYIYRIYHAVSRRCT